MSLIFEITEVERQLKHVMSEARTQQTIYFKTIQGLVEMHQKYRVAKRYDVSDDLRKMLNDIGVEITQGTEGLTFEQIQNRWPTNQPPSGDTWTLKGCNL